MTESHFGRLIALDILGLWVCVLLVGLIGCNSESRGATDESTVAIRTRLQSILSQQTNDQLVAEYWRLLDEHRHRPLLVFGDRTPIGNGCLLLVKPRDLNYWRLIDSHKQERRQPKGSFILYVTPDGISPKPPTKEVMLQDSTLLIGVGNDALIVSIKDRALSVVRG
jgi:hypothetical protein